MLALWVTRRARGGSRSTVQNHQPQLPHRPQPFRGQALHVLYLRCLRNSPEAGNRPLLSTQADIRFTRRERHHGLGSAHTFPVCLPSASSAGPCMTWERLFLLSSQEKRSSSKPVKEEVILPCDPGGARKFYGAHCSPL